MNLGIYVISIYSSFFDWFDLFLETANSESQVVLNSYFNHIFLHISHVRSFFKPSWYCIFLFLCSQYHFSILEFFAYKQRFDRCMIWMWIDLNRYWIPPSFLLSVIKFAENLSWDWKVHLRDWKSTFKHFFMLVILWYKIENNNLALFYRY